MKIGEHYVWIMRVILLIAAISFAAYGMNEAAYGCGLGLFFSFVFLEI